MSAAQLGLKMSQDMQGKVVELEAMQQVGPDARPALRPAPATSEAARLDSHMQ
jgi:hypothetical protein